MPSASRADDWHGEDPQSAVVAGAPGIGRSATETRSIPIETVPAPSLVAAGSDPSGRARRGTGPLFATGVAIGSVAAAGVALRLWRGRIWVPFTSYGYDGNYFLAIVKAILRFGSPLTNPLLGAPFGARLQDYPILSNWVDFGVVRALGLLSKNPAVVANLFFLATFPAIALATFWVLRRWGVSRGTAGAVAMLYSLLPYHLFKGTAHLFLSGYYSVPLAAHVLVEQARNRPLFGVGTAPSRRTLFAGAAILVLVAGSSGYYAAITLVLLAVLLVVQLVLRAPRKVIVGGG